MDRASQEAGLSKGERTRLRLKKCALRLFAQRGVENVSIRDIQIAAGVKNNGSIKYYFASRDALIREIVVDVARLLDAENNRRLDELERRGGPTDIRQVVEILLPSLPPREHRDEDDAYQFRFFTSILITRRELLFEATAGTDSATRRSFEHIRKLAPAMDPVLLRQRLMLMLLFTLTAGCSMEAAGTHGDGWRKLWAPKSAEPNLADMLAGMITAPVSKQTVATIPVRKSRHRSTSANAK